VVADEVRMLASRTTKSTTEINSIVNAIQSATGSVVKEIQRSQEMAEQGSEHIEEAVIKLTSMKDVDSISQNANKTSLQIRDRVTELNSEMAQFKLH